jgi:protein ImuB
VSAEGLERLHPDLKSWAAQLGDELRTAGLQGTVVVGFDRFLAYAVSRIHRGTQIFLHPGQERRAARRAPLARLGIAPEIRDDLARLGIGTLADLLGLPPVGLLQRFGPPLYRLHRLASGALAEGLAPDPEELPIQQTIVLEYPESDAARLLFLIKSKLEPLLAELRGRRQALKVLHLRLLLEGRTPEETSVRPAAPSREPALILDLVRLRLEGMVLESGLLKDGLLKDGVNGIDLLAEGETRLVEQLSLFPTHLKRDLLAAEQALARVRAEFGEESVVRAELREAHLPEDRFAWAPLARVQPAQPPAVFLPTLVRRLFARPQVLGSGHAPFGASSTVHGPYPLSGGWWDAEWNRDYAFSESPRGELLWLYRDRRNERWFLHGRVE